ncbi:MAG TPA: Rieske (2Fe-2S) protein [Candidatus Bipolaricaulis anaerobius]|nr:Rieske (2Fe-2S) protein [Candidatus Bipolaricaulis anaerobius]
MPAWTVVAEADAIGEGELRAVSVAGLPILLVRRQGRAYALDERCPHLGCSLARGTLEGYILKCPCHDWRFDIRTGEFLAAPEIRLPTYPVREAAGKLFIVRGD